MTTEEKSKKDEEEKGKEEKGKGKKKSVKRYLVSGSRCPVRLLKNGLKLQ